MARKTTRKKRVTRRAPEPKLRSKDIPTPPPATTGELLATVKDGLSHTSENLEFQLDNAYKVRDRANAEFDVARKAYQVAKNAQFEADGYCQRLSKLRELLKVI